MADRHAVARRGREIDVVVADRVVGHDRERGEPGQERLVDLGRQLDAEAPDPRSMLGDQPLEVLRVGKARDLGQAIENRQWTVRDRRVDQDERRIAAGTYFHRRERSVCGPVRLRSDTSQENGPVWPARPEPLYFCLPPECALSSIG